MSESVRIGLIGDYDPQVRAHQAIPKALAMAAPATGCEVEPTWLATDRLHGQVEHQLAGFDALWCVPASPYRDMQGVLRAIRFARESGKPFLGTCGGFQHAVIEYARHGLGLADADHAESNPGAAMPLISPLECSLVGARGKIVFEPGSQLARIYGATETMEEYHCRYGLNPRFEDLIGNGPLRISGRDGSGAVRAVELSGHPFFVATLYQPELSAFSGSRHPLIMDFIRAALEDLSDPPAG